MCRKILQIIQILFVFLLSTSVYAGLVIDNKIPAGNIAVEEITGDTVNLHQERRDTKGWWFYWAFRVCGAEGRSLTFNFTDGNPVGGRGPAVSLDKGLSWHWLDKDFSASGFRYIFDSSDKEVWFAMSMVYTQLDWDRFISGYAASPYIEHGRLAVSRKGRPVEKLRLGCINKEPRYRVALTCRHHACEMMASYVVEGIIEGVMADNETGAWLRKNVEFLIIPFVDKDGVEDGDQGKNRKPRDHNRDYSGECVHIETAAIRKQLPEWAGDKLLLAIDIHCPWIRGSNNEWVYQVGADDPRQWAAQQKLGHFLERVSENTLAYKQSNDLPFGSSWNTGGNYSQGMGYKKWASTKGGARFATSFEIPYARANGTVVDESNCRRFGNGMAEAIRQFLMDD